MKQSVKSNIILKELEINSFLSFKIYHPYHPIYCVQEHTLTIPKYYENIEFRFSMQTAVTAYGTSSTTYKTRSTAYGISSTTNGTSSTTN